MLGDKQNWKFIAMTVWVCILGIFAYWFEMDTKREERIRALATANAFFQQLVISRQWNALHGGVYVPITATTQPNEYLSIQNRDLTADNGLKLTKINPAYMTRQIAELAEKNKEGMQFHITSLNPIRPQNKAKGWEKQWLESFEDGVKAQGEFFKDRDITWFRYMAPLIVKSECLQCHAQQGYKEGDIRGGISISIPYITHDHFHLMVYFGSVSSIGLILIFLGGTILERKQRLFDATFNSPVPAVVTDLDYTILMANEAYWATFGTIPAHKKTIRCHEHRRAEFCHTENCPVDNIKRGLSIYTSESGVEIAGVPRYFISTAKPLHNNKGLLIGCVESFQEITELKETEKALEASNRKFLALSITDGLTGIANRRHFDEVLEQEYVRHARSGEKLSLIILDIDYFKKFNDSYGHVAGDKCLQQVARVLVDYTNRPADLSARYGGEEFACILPETDRSGAVAIAEKIRQGIIECAIPHKESSVAACVTASLGVVTVQCKTEKSAKDIVAQADELLYFAKKFGRNRVEVIAPGDVGEDIKGDLVRLVWKDHYCCGNLLIDSQHQSLFDVSNRLFDAVSSNRTAVEVDEIITRLLDDVSQHFKDEEKILETVGFPDLSLHVEEHTKLLEKGLELSQKFKDCTLTTGDVFQFLVAEVVMDHMCKADRDYFPFIKEASSIEL